jgi:hypothetical protein
VLVGLGYQQYSVLKKLLIGIAELDTLLKTAIDFRARLRFPRVPCEPPRLRLRGLTLATFPAGVFVLHSNQPLNLVKFINRILKEHLISGYPIQLVISISPWAEIVYQLPSSLLKLIT